MAAASFAALLAADRHVTGSRWRRPLPAHAAEIASVSSPPLSAIVDQMLEESKQRDARRTSRARSARSRPASPPRSAGRPRRWSPNCGRLGVGGGLYLVDGISLSRRTRSRRPRWSRWSSSPPPTPGCARCWPGCRWPVFPARCRAERVQRDRRRGPRLGPGQDRQSRHGDGPGRTGHRRTGRRSFSPSWPTRSRP